MQSLKPKLGSKQDKYIPAEAAGLSKASIEYIGTICSYRGM